MLTNRRDVIVAGGAILSILLIIILREDAELYDIKVDATKIAFFFIFPQLFAGLSIHRAIFVSYFNLLRTYHRVFGYTIIGAFLVISSFCIFVNVPMLKGLNVAIISHMIFGILGFCVFPLKLYWVGKSPYTHPTAILGIIFATIFTGLFVTGVLLF
ncbi:MAG TPA: hypothetical protein VIO11_05010 [Candidatus Methanoperedens sp.]